MIFSHNNNAQRVMPAQQAIDSATASSLAFARDLLTGLSQPQKNIPCIWFYDHRGSQLFEDITRLPEYYPTRTETRLLQGLVGEVATTVGPHAQLIELGSGSSVKTRLLLQAMQELAAYVPVDISEAFLNDAVAGLLRDFPQLVVKPVVADFTAPFALPRLPTQLHGQPSPRLGFFPGSTIGNFSPEAATTLLTQFAQALGPQAWLLIGVDTTQNLALLLPAYDDAQGVTADFNRNLLSRVNRELGANFHLNHFHHAARFDATAGRVEMHLVSEIKQTVKVLGHSFDFQAGESIHTENAYKYTASAFMRLASNAGWREQRVWCDTEGTGFSVFLMRSAV
jgi:L-histidine N-alpha-methyltransferase